MRYFNKFEVDKHNVYKLTSQSKCSANHISELSQKKVTGKQFKKIQQTFEKIRLANR